MDSVTSMLKLLHAPPADAETTEVQTCCLLLLGLWVNSELYRPLSKPCNPYPICNPNSEYSAPGC